MFEVHEVKDTCILHCDMNAYYASVEMKLNPRLRGKAVAVGGSREDRNGVILAKSQLAKEAGVKTGEIIAEAKGKCPELIVVPPQYDAYIYYSHKARELYYQYTDQVEPFGLDECWLDVTGSRQLFGPGDQIADELRRRMREELGLTISVGVSYSKVLAKLGSDLKKPDATTVIREQDLSTMVWKLPVGDLLGVGPATEAKLRDRGILTIGQLAQASPSQLQAKLGINGWRLWRWANGWDEGRVHRWGEKQPVKTIGHGLTLRRDIYSKLELKSVFSDLSQELSRRMRAEGVKAGGVQISLRTASFQYRELQAPLPYPSQAAMYLAQAAYALAVKELHFTEPYRAVAIRAIYLVPVDQPLQLNFFSDAQDLDRLERVELAFEDLQNRYGQDIVHWGWPDYRLKKAQATPWDICPPGMPY